MDKPETTLDYIHWLEATNAELLAALEAMVEAECDYMKVNNLGDPEKQHNIIRARAVIARAKE